MVTFIHMIHAPTLTCTTYEHNFKLNLSYETNTFQRLMNNVLKGINGTKAVVCLDDIIIYAADLEEHEMRLREIVTQLCEHSLHLQPSKCQFLCKEVIYLGYMITDQGVKPDPEKIICVQNYPTLKNVTEIKQFLGLTGYYRRFVEKYSEIAKPIPRC